MCYDRAVNDLDAGAPRLDRTSIEGLRVDASVGVYDFEYRIKQTLVIDVVAHADLRPAGETDALEDAVDYDRISAICRTVVESRHHRLIETIAGRIAAGVLESLPQVQAVDVRVAKPGAVPDAETVAVQIQRRRPSTS